MANTNDTKPYVPNPQDVLDAKASQLCALLQNTYGEAGESFRNMNDTLQDNYLWACADMASEIVNTLHELSNRRMAALGLTPVSDKT